MCPSGFLSAKLWPVKLPTCEPGINAVECALQVCDMLNMKVFVDTDDDVRLARRCAYLRRCFLLD